MVKISEERVKFNISPSEMLRLNLKCGSTNLEKNLHNELIGLAMNFHDCQDLDPGDVVWAKITGIFELQSGRLSYWLLGQRFQQTESNCILIAQLSVKYD